MRTTRRFFVAFAACLMFIAGASGAAAQAQQAQSQPAGVTVDAPLPQSPLSLLPPANRDCPATGITGQPTDRPPIQLEPYFLGDWRLGPLLLPNDGPVGALVHDYHRTGGLSPHRFLACYWDPSADNNRGGWRYPPNGGFADGIVTVTLYAGQYIDRFGANSGRFLSPFGVDFSERALPPSNLNTFELRYPNDYHVFRVLKEFQVDGGLAAPWFGQPGGGLQYRLDDRYFPGEVAPPEHVNTQWLIDHDYLEPVN